MEILQEKIAYNVEVAQIQIKIQIPTSIILIYILSIAKINFLRFYPCINPISNALLRRLIFFASIFCPSKYRCLKIT